MEKILGDSDDLELKFTPLHNQRDGLSKKLNAGNVRVQSGMKGCSGKSPNCVPKVWLRWRAGRPP